MQRNYIKELDNTTLEESTTYLLSEFTPEELEGAFYITKYLFSNPSTNSLGAIKSILHAAVRTNRQLGKQRS